MPLILLSLDSSLLSVPNQNGLLPIQIAANRGYSPLIKLIAKHGADIEVTTQDGKTPVMLACQVLKPIDNMKHKHDTLL